MAAGRVALPGRMAGGADWSAWVLVSWVYLGGGVGHLVSGSCGSWDAGRVGGWC